MELVNFGSIMKFAIDRESDVKTLLEHASSNAALSSMGSKITGLAEINRKNIKLLETTRRENICEMVLHPIAGLDSEDYMFAAPPAGGLTEDGFRAILEDANGKLSRFYNDAADKLPADDAKRAFHKLAKKRYS